MFKRLFGQGSDKPIADKPSASAEGISIDNRMPWEPIRAQRPMPPSRI
jgi:hypothetical protein